MAAPMDTLGCGLMYPELLTCEGLHEILRQRYIPKANLKSLDKEELLKLYYQYVLPLPQRKYRLNHRGREMTKKQILMAKKRRIANSSSADSEPPSKKRSTGSQLLTPLGSSSATLERLKPPPSCINYDKKVIKLNSNNNSCSDEKVKATLKEVKISPDGHKKTVISLKKTPVEINTTQKSDDVEMKDINQTSEPDSPKKKIKKISWP